MTQPAADNRAVLTVSAVDLSYAIPNHEPLHVLRTIDLEVLAGEFVCLAGRSGSGKSSLLYVAAGLLRPDAGSVEWCGEAIDGLSDAAVTARRRETVGFVFQSGGLVDMLTAAENVALPGLSGRPRAKGQEAARALDLLKLVGLKDRAEHYPAQLSGGERQRVAVARAMFHEPPLLIVDEPTASLDAASARQMVTLLSDIRDRGSAVLVASHDEHVLSGADRVTRLE